MSATGIGASVKRKEDIRYITGKGQYTDDINRHGQTYAYFLRSPHAHATLNKIDIAHARKMPGVHGIFTGGKIVAGENAMHAGHFPGMRNIDFLQRRMGMRRAQKIRVGLAVPIDVIGILALAGDVADVFLALDRRADACGGHGVLPENCDLKLVGILL